MLAESDLHKKFWVEAINTTCHILNKAMVRPILNRTPYELLKGKKPNVSYFKPFRVKYFVHNNNKENLDKFDFKSESGYFLGYSDNLRSYRVFHIKNNYVEESSHVLFEESNVDRSHNRDFNEEFPKIKPVKENQGKEQNLQGSIAEASQLDDPSSSRNLRYFKNHLLENILENLQDGTRTRSSFKQVQQEDLMAFLSQTKPRDIHEALKDESWIYAM